MTYTFPEAEVGLVEALCAIQIPHVQVKVVEIYFPSWLSAICHLLPPVECLPVTDRMTNGEGLVLNKMLAAFGMGVGFRLDVAHEIGLETEGSETRRIELVQAVEQAPDELRKHILGKLIESAYKRSKLYDMEIPALDQMANDAGVNLREAMGDDKPDQPEEAMGNEKP